MKRICDRLSVFLLQLPKPIGLQSAFSFLLLKDTFILAVNDKKLYQIGKIFIYYSSAE